MQARTKELLDFLLCHLVMRSGSHFRRSLERKMERAKGFEPKGPGLPAFQKADVSNHTRTGYKGASKKARPSEGTKAGHIFQESSGNQNQSTSRL
jgi:hypothetical protein